MQMASSTSGGGHGKRIERSFVPAGAEDEGGGVDHRDGEIADDHRVLKCAHSQGRRHLVEDLHQEECCDHLTIASQ